MGAPVSVLVVSALGVGFWGWSSCDFGRASAFAYFAGWIAIATSAAGVTGQSVFSHFQAVVFTLSKLERLVPTLGVTECQARAPFTGTPTAQ